jgi:hypothetical protein
MTCTMRYMHACAHHHRRCILLLKTSTVLYETIARFPNFEKLQCFHKPSRETYYVNVYDKLVLDGAGALKGIIYT